MSISSVEREHLKARTGARWPGTNYPLGAWGLSGPKRTTGLSEPMPDIPHEPEEESSEGKGWQHKYNTQIPGIWRLLMPVPFRY